MNDLGPVQLTAQSVPFSLTTRQGSQEICPAPLVCVDDFAGVIFHLNKISCVNLIINRLNQLTGHGGVIPPNEVWIKLGGDKGGLSVMMSFQIMNTEKP